VITDDKIRDAITLMNRERALRRSLAELMKQDPPPMSGRQLLSLKSSISGIPADLAQYEAALELLKTKPGPISQSEKVRVLMTGAPMSAAGR
jgi:benzoyl-CoA reductase/2-hydroxyglutaryl-CoA dehydratase subunit BcrC/BadD/HgdB